MTFEVNISLYNFSPSPPRLHAHPPAYALLHHLALAPHLLLNAALDALLADLFSALLVDAVGDELDDELELVLVLRPG